MTKLVKFRRHEVKELSDRRWLLKALYGDEDGNEYVWAPRWDDLHSLYRNAARIERLNGGKDPEGFVKVARTIFTEQEVDKAQLAVGYFNKVEKGRLVLSRYGGLETDELTEEREVYPVAFALDEGFLMEYLGHQVQCLVVNGQVCRVSRCRY